LVVRNEIGKFNLVQPVISIRNDKEVNRVPEMTLHIAKPEKAQRGSSVIEASRRTLRLPPLSGNGQSLGRLQVANFSEELLILGGELLFADNTGGQDCLNFTE
jgi:hypothetical protein